MNMTDEQRDQLVEALVQAFVHRYNNLVKYWLDFIGII